MPRARKCEKRNYSRNPEHSSLHRDYEYARARTIRHWEEGYQTASHFAEVIANRGRYKSEKGDLEKDFRHQVMLWKNETGHLSSITKALAHPAYLRIIGLARNSSGAEIEELLLKELESDPDHWFAALTAITGEDPVKPEHDFDESVEAWIEWGRQRGVI